MRTDIQSFAVASDHETTSAPSPSHDSETVFSAASIVADVSFGILNHSGDCVNIGICRVTVDRNPHEAGANMGRCAFAHALMGTNRNGRLWMFFPKAGMRPCTESAFFRKDFFEVPVTFQIPEAVYPLLEGLHQGAITAGSYPVRRLSEGYHINFF